MSSAENDRGEAEMDQTWPSLGCGMGAILVVYLEPRGVQKVAWGLKQNFSIPCPLFSRL